MTTTPALPAPPSPAVLARFDRDGFVVLRGAFAPHRRTLAHQAAERLLTSTTTAGRDRGADGKDGFRGVLNLDDTLLPLVANPPVLAAVTALLSTNIHLLSSHLIALPSLPPGTRRSIRTSERPGWHRDMYGVTDDLGPAHTPRLAIKAAYYLTDVGPETGTTMFLPGSHTDTGPITLPPGAIDPPGAVTPAIGPYDVLLFENRTWHAGGPTNPRRRRSAREPARAGDSDGRRGP